MCCLLLVISFIFDFFFFFSSRRRHTRSYGDWSSDVCSSDLEFELPGRKHRNHSVGPHGFDPLVLIPVSWLASNDHTLRGSLSAAVQLRISPLVKASR